MYKNACKCIHYDITFIKYAKQSNEQKIVIPPSIKYKPILHNIPIDLSGAHSIWYTQNPIIKNKINASILIFFQGSFSN